MLCPIVAWLAIYTVLIYVLGLVVRPWRDRSWFKALFLPGILVAIALQKVSAALCLGVPCTISPLEDGRPAFGFDARRVPCLAGALFILVCHFFIYVVFIFSASKLDSAGLVETDVVSLPTLHAHQVANGYVRVDARGYVRGVGRLLDFSRERFLFTAALLYVAAGVFASVTFTRRQCRWGMIGLAALGVVAYIADWFETGFPFLTRGWWARFFYFPDWWALFSLYVTSLILALSLFASARLAPVVLRAVLRPRREEKRDGG